MPSPGLRLGAGLFALGLLTACANQPETQPGETRAEERTRVADLNTQLGLEYMRDGNNETALKRLEKAVETDPKHAPAYTALALLYSRLGEVAKAEANFQAALRLAPNNGNTLNNYGMFLCQQKRYADGEAALLKAVKNPLYAAPAIAYTNAGLCAEQAGNPKAAEDYFRQALEINPNIGPALFGMAELSFKRGDAEGAAQYLNRHLKSAGASARALALGVQIEKQTANHDRQASYEMMVRNQFPDSPETGQLQRGELY